MIWKDNETKYDTKVSVVIPVYKKHYLEKCIESVVNQSYTNLQIILVDDGSTDGSADICKHFQRKDNHILNHS